MFVWFRGKHAFRRADEISLYYKSLWWSSYHCSFIFSALTASSSTGTGSTSGCVAGNDETTWLIPRVLNEEEISSLFRRWLIGLRCRPSTDHNKPSLSWTFLSLSARVRHNVFSYCPIRVPCSVISSFAKNIVWVWDPDPHWIRILGAPGSRSTLF